MRRPTTRRAAARSGRSAKPPNVQLPSWVCVGLATVSAQHVVAASLIPINPIRAWHTCEPLLLLPSGVTIGPPRSQLRSGLILLLVVRGRVAVHPGHRALHRLSLQRPLSDFMRCSRLPHRRRPGPPITLCLPMLGRWGKAPAALARAARSWLGLLLLGLEAGCRRGVLLGCRRNALALLFSLAHSSRRHSPT